MNILILTPSVSVGAVKNGRRSPEDYEEKIFFLTGFKHKLSLVRMTYSLLLLLYLLSGFSPFTREADII